MRLGKPLVFGLVLACVSTAAFVPMLRSTSARSVRLTDPGGTNAASGFDYAHSAALFVGVRTFRNDELPEVPFAVDDAIDLAHLFALDERVHLVAPQRVVLALSGEAVKPESRRRLRELQDAGARVVKPEHLLALVEQQAKIASGSGVLIVSMATHGYTSGGVPFVRGFSEPLSTAKMLDVIEEQAVPRSFMLIDACRTRVTGTGRGLAQTAAAIEHVMPHIRGNVMLSAVGEAYDDQFRHNGVMTATVLEALDCKASARQCRITPETLATYVERGVHDWIAKHHIRTAGSAIQISIDGEARNMPLAHCCVSRLHLRLAVKNSVVTAFEGARKVWTRNLDGPIVSAGIADMAAVVGTRSELVAFNVTGKEVWRTSERSPLRTFVTEDLFQKHCQQVVALWGSRMTIYSAEGHVLSMYDHPHLLDHLAICRPTAHHAPRIVVTAANSVFLFNPKKIATGKPLWSGRLMPSSESIAGVKIIDYNHDTKRDIAIETASGKTLYLDFNGKVIGRGPAVDFRLDHARRRR